MTGKWRKPRDVVLPQGHWVECLENPMAYSAQQVAAALKIAFTISRGRFVLCETPAKCPVCFGSKGEFCVVCKRS